MNASQQVSQAATTAAKIPNTQLLIVTGKGGVGKTAIATALATASARQGRRTLLTIYERDDIKHPCSAYGWRISPCKQKRTCG